MPRLPRSTLFPYTTLFRSRDQPIVIVADPGRESEAALRLGRIGFDHTTGYLEGGLHSVASRPDLVATTGRVSPPLAAARLGAAAPLAPLVLDVRTPREHAQQHL